MKILITGGTGLIGRALCRALLDAGHQLTRTLVREFGHFLCVHEVGSELG